MVFANHRLFLMKLIMMLPILIQSSDLLIMSDVYNSDVLNSDVLDQNVGVVLEGWKFLAFWNSLAIKHY